MYIYAEKITPRLQYIADTLFAGSKVTLTSSSAEFYGYDGPKINYSKKKFSDAELLVRPSGLLYEAGINKQDIVCSDWNGLKIFFQTKGDLPFDIFSAAFYLLSRYEEYLPHKKDSYGRFAHENSIAFKEGFLQLPLVNLWKEQFCKLLQQKFTGFQLTNSTFSFVPTYDIDIAFAYKGKNLVRKIMSRLRKEQAMLNGRDVFDVYDWLDELHSSYQLHPTYFFLLAKRSSRYDKNLSRRSPALQGLIKRISAKYAIGIHPSWQSYQDESLIKKEIKELEKIAQKKITASRQHYIQFTLPHTYRSLIEAAITNEYSMGYGSINGFRASVASPFYWYDLMKEQSTSLLLHPFCYMEANAHFEQRLSAEEAAKELQHYFNVVKDVNGELITIFHNHFLTEQPQWQPWREMYTGFLARNFMQGQAITSPSLQEQL
jgi:hypothetical protein